MTLPSIRAIKRASSSCDRWDRESKLVALAEYCVLAGECIAGKCSIIALQHAAATPRRDRFFPLPDNRARAN
jgi:hypothetical protein